MSIRLSGMVSGMDTDSMVEELVKAYSTKKDNIVKSQTKLSWKTDAWKSLNTKIYSFYSKTLSNMRFTQMYNSKKTSVSDTSKASVIAGDSAVTGSQTLAVKQLATAGYLTGGKIETAAGTKPTADTTLADLGITSDSSMTVNTGGQSYTINLNASSKLSDIAKQISATGLGASYDAKNQRFFINAKTTGTESDFTLTGNSATAMSAMSAMGIYVASDATNNSEYITWADYASTTNPDGTRTTLSRDEALANMADLITNEVAKRKENYHKESEDAQAVIDQNNTYLNGDGENAGALVEAAADALYQEAAAKLTGDLSDYGIADDSTATDEEKIATILKKDLENAKKADSGKTDEEKAAIAKAASLAANISIAKANVTSATEKKAAADDKFDGAQEAVENEFYEKAVNAINVVSGAYDSQGSQTAVRINGQDGEIFLNGATFTSTSNTYSINGLTITAKEVTGLKADATGDLNDASNYNTVSLTTDTDIDGIYNNIKNFLKEYNSLVSEMDKLYNAASSKGYEPLTDEEKKAMSDDEVEKWETKIKDALLRRDDTLDGVTNAMKSAMSMSYKAADGTSYSLSTFGISTLSYFLSGDNDKGVYHIDGDPDDGNTSANEDKLKTMIAADPEAVQNFFTKLSSGLYSALSDKMKSTSMSSAYTVYDDKQMASDYSDYTTTIKNWEEKLKKIEDRYYKQFSKMETAMAKMNSSQTALAGLLGNS